MHTVKYTCLYVQVRVPVPVGLEHELIVGLDCAFDALAHPGLQHELGVALPRNGREVRLPPVLAVEQRRAHLYRIGELIGGALYTGVVFVQSSRGCWCRSRSCMVVN